jgi:hypothetical protein
LIEKDLDFEELEKFENYFKRDELLDIKNVWKFYLILIDTRWEREREREREREDLQNY